MLTETEQAVRKTAIGASEAAAVLGVDPYRTPFQVWAEKTGRLDGFEGNKATDSGTRFEPAVLQWAEEQLGPLAAHGERWELPGYPIASTLDAATSNLLPVEAKTAGLFGPLPAGWGAEGTDEVPDNYLVQCQVQMLCTNAELAYLAAFLGGRGFCMFKIARSNRMVDYIKSQLAEWWERHIVADLAPPMTNVSVDVLRRLKREPNKTVDIPAELALRHEATKAALDAAKEAADESQAAILAAMGDAEAANFGDPARLLTFYEQTRKAHSVKESKFRVLRFSKRG